jgi:hypothetical protein
MVDYRMKYKEMKAKMLESIDVSYRLGYEQGYKEATQEAQMAQIQQQMQQAQMMQQAAMGAQQDPNAMAAQGASPDQQAEMMGQEVSPEMQGGMPEMQGQEMNPEEEMEGSQANELDQYLAELESMVAKGEKPNVLDLRKKFTEISNLRKAQKDKMKSNRQQVVSAQKSIVDNLIKKWTSKTEETSEDIEKLIREKGIDI